MYRALAVLALTASTLTSRASGQVGVQGIRDLNFGVVLPGVQSSVAPTDPIKSGQFYFQTPGIGSRVRIRFNLPNRLSSPGGAQMSIQFANNDGLLMGTSPTSFPVSFNPRATTVLRASTSSDANVYLGGTVSPSAGQAPGSYTGTIVMTITVF